MATKLRRIAVTVDPQLASALQKARRELPGKSDAALVKELALRGSSLNEGPETESALQRILSRPGVRPAERKLDSVLANLHKTQKLDPEEISEFLEEEREDREIW